MITYTFTRDQHQQLPDHIASSVAFLGDPTNVEMVLEQ